MCRKRKQPENELTDVVSKLNMELKKTLSEWKLDMDNNFAKLNENISTIKADLDTLTRKTADTKSQVNAIQEDHLIMQGQVRSLDKNYAEVSTEISALQASTQYQSDQQEDINKRIIELETHIKNKSDSSATITALESKIDSLEQQSRQCNIEIGNVPERRGENLTELVMEIGKVIRCTIGQSDIISVHRVPHAKKGNDRPKNIILKLTTRVLRDNVLSAFRLSHKGLKSNQLNISGTVNTVYLNEHLTIKNKILFHDARKAAKQNNYKYVWVRNATILVRETDTSPTFAVRSQKDIIKIRSRGGPNPNPSSSNINSDS